MNSDNFICPECGSRETNVSMLVEPELNATNPWSSVLQIDKCAKCGCDIPAHLGERWNGRTEEQAAEEWKRVYRPTMPSDSEED